MGCRFFEPFSLFSLQGKRDELWSGVKSFVIATGPTSEDLKYLKSVAIQQYLMGYEVPDTIMGFLPDKVCHTFRPSAVQSLACSCIPHADS